eukprot:11268534-Prorocentrum_lima.AAC.1
MVHEMPKRTMGRSDGDSRVAPASSKGLPSSHVCVITLSPHHTGTGDGSTRQHPSAHADARASPSS